MIYVASSWRCIRQIAVVAALKAAAQYTGDDRFLPYDFREPKPGQTGFHWSDTGMPTYEINKKHAEVPTVPAAEYLQGLMHPFAQKGFALDYEAMKQCDTCVLVLPCGRSAHLELGWFVGQARLTAVLLDDPVVPELMYKMVDYIAPDLFSLLGWLGVPDA